MAILDDGNGIADRGAESRRADEKRIRSRREGWAVRKGDEVQFEIRYAHTTTFLFQRVVTTAANLGLIIRPTGRLSGLSGHY
ncbi:hypothetical protein E4U40_006167 [Claviceps sp. LM458 group G5]|nr:hypothetical protein E4U40_006167 [Claviceps sp. LM458 group G5]